MTLPLFDFFAGMPTAGIVGGMLLVLAVLGYTGAPLWSWALAGAVGLYGGGAPLWVWIPYGASWPSSTLGRSGARCPRA
jgi:hypothetical protein